ncbi:jun dimerization protein 2 isoform X3 [Carassius carassius]|uniref:jun dimerization protein 2 isoform X3 n=1 Tax=Carassius carassius TaxID=217509 RepID=UPI002868D2D7|nr:jun dimerization protein 2 isoform X3 [Carassius carassius]
MKVFPEDLAEGERGAERSCRYVTGTALCFSGLHLGIQPMMPGQIPDPLMTAGSLPSVGPLAGIPSTTLTDQLKLAELYSLGTVLSPLILNRHAKRPFDVINGESDDDEERKKRRREKNKVAAARCRNRKKERTDQLQKESERLETLNSVLKSQIEDLKSERQQLIVMLNLHRPTCIVRIDTMKSTESE